MSVTQPSWVVRGNPTPQELAAVVAAVVMVLAAHVVAAGAAPPPARRGGWSDPARRLRPTPPLRPRT